MKMNLRKVFALLLCACLLLPALASCAPVQSGGSVPSATPGGKTSAAPTGGGNAGAPELSGELRIAALYNSSIEKLPWDFSKDYASLEELAYGFMMLHRNVTVRVDYELSRDYFDSHLNDEERKARLDAFVQRVATGYQEGNGPDVVNVSGLDYYSLFEQELFEDLYTYMDKDQTFRREEYFENIFTALEYYGGLYALPTAVSMKYVHLNRTITDALEIDTDEISAISGMQLLEIYDRALAEGLVEAVFFGLGTSGRKSEPEEELYHYLDERSREASFDSPEFLAYLEASQRVRTSYIGGGLTSYEEEDLEHLKKHTNLFIQGNSLVSDLPDMLSEKFPHYRDAYTQAIPLSQGQQGKERTFTAPNMLGITESSENKELAWEFIKYCIAESTVVSYNGGRGWNGDRFIGHIPVNRNNLKKYLASAQKNWPILPRVTPDEITEGCAMLESWMEGINTAPSFFDLHSLEDILDDYYYCYYHYQGLTAEECAKQIQARVESYLAG